jgi:hypothetical protein
LALGSKREPGGIQTEAKQRSSFKLARMVEAVGSLGSRGVGIAGMSSTLEEVQMQETLIFSDTIKVSSSFIQIRVPAFIFSSPSTFVLPFQTTTYLAF